MKVVIQRVQEASVKINDTIVGAINQGLLVLASFVDADNQEDYDWIINKIINLRIFNDENRVMNLSCLDLQAEILLVSQFTLHASTKKGNRPSYLSAAKPEVALLKYETFKQTLAKLFPREIKTGEFGADMKVSLVNDGPVTIIIDSKNRT